MRRIAILIMAALLVAVPTTPMTAKEKKMSKKELKQIKGLEEVLDDFFKEFSEGDKNVSYDKYRFDRDAKTLDVFGNEAFSQRVFREKDVKEMYKFFSKNLKKPFNSFTVTIYADEINVFDLIASETGKGYVEKVSRSDAYWGDMIYRGNPWVKNVSEPFTTATGLQNHHLSLWASHGMYYDQKKKKSWQWQRPPLFLTREDLFTQMFVVPYLIPMLENAGAVVFTPRERDWQRNEVIIDRDIAPGLAEKFGTYNENGKWEDTGLTGFSYHAGYYYDNENPFLAGGGRMTESAKKQNASVSYVPNIPQAGEYAVYVSYHTMENSVDDAHYTVCHKGVKTEFRVNQRMGSHTWVYLGTFSFDAGQNQNNYVMLTNDSKHSGVVTADAVRFGGGMGNISRGGSTSGFPRCMECSRYYAQWAGMDYDVYSNKGGKDDYADDLYARELMTNYLAGGSVYQPNHSGQNVPIELTLAVHSDAGYHTNGADIYGTLGICTTTKNDVDTFENGRSRQISALFATTLKDNLKRDLTTQFGNWAERGMRDRNYAETRVPEVPSAIIETLSHQSFPDMKMAWDPNFRFELARSLYKTVLRFVNTTHGTDYAVTPLTPENFRIEFLSNNKIKLSWSSVIDATEKSAAPVSYILYTQTGNNDFDNGMQINSNSHIMKLQPNKLYNFRLVAVNSGGKSFPTDVLSAYYNPNSKKKILIINGFHRLSCPAVVNDSLTQGFDVDEDPGMWIGKNPGWYGKQVSFNKSKMGSEASSGLGYTNSVFAGSFLMGNNGDNVAVHADAIARCRKYSFCSCSTDAITNKLVDLKPYNMVDLILGNEKNDGRSLVWYKTFTPKMQESLSRYLRKGGALMVSGSYVASDISSNEDSVFAAEYLHYGLAGVKNRTTDDKMSGLGVNFTFYRSLNEEHYAATSTDILQPVYPAYSAMTYSDGQPSCVAYTGKDCSTFVMGFPFECIRNAETRASLMTGILSFLIK